MHCTVVTASRSASIGGGLTYCTDDAAIQPGMAVRVPLRKGWTEGIVTSIEDSSNVAIESLKSIQRTLSPHPILTESQLRTAQWMSEYYCCPLRQSIGSWLPPLPWIRTIPSEEVGYSLSSEQVTGRLRGRVQLKVLEYLTGKDWVSSRELREETGASSSVLNSLLLRGVIRESIRVLPISAPVFPQILTSPSLTSEQHEAFTLLQHSLKPSLLFGITGSGKTEIYAKLIEAAVLRGRQALYLVPDILLTEQCLSRMQCLLPRDSIAVLHSKLGQAEWLREWHRIHSGAVSLVIGSRSAIFAPLQHLGVIIVDEEHEWTYKNEQSPRYHVRDVATTLARHANAKLVFGSATPSLETWANAKNDIFQLVALPVRYQDRPLPRVTVVDLAQTNFGSLYPFSPQLLSAIRQRLERKEQSILFLNRRGAATSLLCLECRRRVVCPESQLPYTVYATSSGQHYLFDHTTGTTAQYPAHCPHCSGVRLTPVGAGTQGVEKTLRGLFPSARILRADADTLQSPSQIRILLTRLQNGEADILIGTQPVVKGLDLPLVTLAAVLVADVGLSLPHFRAGERVFQLLFQLTGRSGRSLPGDVIIQTFRPEAEEVVAAVQHDAKSYLDRELILRARTGYPPLTSIIRLLFKGQLAQRQAVDTKRQLVQKATITHSDAHVSAGPTFYGAGKVWQVLIRGTQPQALLRSVVIPPTVAIDVDPVETI